MKDYGALLCSHLSRYKKRRLGISEDGSWGDKSYSHILPPNLGELNFLESFRAEICDYLRRHPEIKLHRGWRHLNSSQIFALNLFYPFFTDKEKGRPALCSALQAPSATKWGFEFVLDPEEGTNIDVNWETKEDSLVFCEVKLSENGFGTAKGDEHHLDKLEKTYREKLKSLVRPDSLAESFFFQNYQLLRYIWLLAENRHRLIVFFPRENESIDPQLDRVLEKVKDETRARISKVYVEDCINRLRSDTNLPPALQVYASQLAEKYIVPFDGTDISRPPHAIAVSN
jgi:hypothetical protein